MAEVPSDNKQTGAGAEISSPSDFYRPIPLFGRMGKITIDCAPFGSGRAAYADSSVKSGASSFSSGVNSGGGWSGGGGGDGFTTTPSDPGGGGGIPAGLGLIDVEICVDGVIQNYQFLGRAR